MHTIVLRLICCVLFCTITFSIQGQDFLAKKVTIHAVQKPAKVIFDDLAKQTEVVFTYGAFDDNQIITLDAEDQPLRSVLQIIQVKTSCSIHTKGKYVIVKSVPRPPQEIQLYGTIYDKETGETLPE